MSAGIFHRKPRKLKSEINVVPYIDVMLVLLIIFMVTAPLLTLSVDVKLPSMNAKAVNNTKEPIVVVAYPDEGVFGLMLPGEKKATQMDAAALQAKLAPIKQQQGNEFQVTLAAQGDASYQRVIDAMKVLQSANIKNVSLSTKAGG